MISFFVGNVEAEIFFLLLPMLLNIILHSSQLLAIATRQSLEREIHGNLTHRKVFIILSNTIHNPITKDHLKERFI